MSLLEVNRLSLGFGAVKALDQVSLAVTTGSLHAIIGPNGAGKTSLMNCISGLYRPNAGRIHFHGQDITALRPDQIASRGCARMFQNLALFDQLSVLENLLVGRHHTYESSFLRQILGAARSEEARQHARVEWILDFLHLERYRDVPVAIVPYGVRKRLELGRALAMAPKLILLDEPAAGLNQEETEDLARTLLEVKSELGVTQVLIEHELGMVMDLADRITVLDFGRVIADGTAAEIKSDPAVLAAYVGASA